MLVLSVAEEARAIEIAGDRRPRSCDRLLVDRSSALETSWFAKRATTDPLQSRAWSSNQSQSERLAEWWDDLDFDSPSSVAYAQADDGESSILLYKKRGTNTCSSAHGMLFCFFLKVPFSTNRNLSRQLVGFDLYAIASTHNDRHADRSMLHGWLI